MQPTKADMLKEVDDLVTTGKPEADAITSVIERYRWHDEARDAMCELAYKGIVAERAHFVIERMDGDDGEPRNVARPGGPIREVAVD